MMASTSSSAAMPPTSPPPPPTEPDEPQNEEEPSGGEGGGRGEEEEEEEEDEDEEEEEPQLKYERIGGDIAKVVRGDLVSTFCVGSKIIVHNPLKIGFNTVRPLDRIMARYIYSI
jgi:hypothetical protein